MADASAPIRRMIHAATPAGSASAHPSRGVRRALRIVLLGLVFTAVALTAVNYLAGYLFLWSLRGADPLRTTPLTAVRYAYYYGEDASVRGRLKVCFATALGLTAAAALACALPKPRSLHGDARFARRREIAAAGLLGADGIILGRLGGRYLMLPGQQGVCLAAPPRAGKGTGVVVPNALNWPGSLICVDIKRENWTITAGFRAANGQRCYLFEPLAEDGRTARWNPLSYVAAEPARRGNDIQRIADMLYPEAPGTDPFWIASARSLFLGISLYLFETPSAPKTIGEVLRQGMASDDEGFGHHWKRIVEGRNSGRYPLSGECVRALYDVIDLAPVTASSIRKTFTSRLDLWLNPILDAATSADDFDLRKLRSEPMSVYVAVHPDDLRRLRPVLSLLFEQAIGLQTRELPEHNPALQYQVLALLDECTALGRIPIISEAISYLPGYNVRVLLVIQATAQLREVYGAHNAETMLKSLAARIVFAPKDHSDAREISDELGATTVRVRSRSQSQFSWGGAHARANVTVSEQRRPLLLPQEVQQIGPERQIIFYEGLRPIRCQKVRYFRDRRFQARLLPPPCKPAPQWRPLTLHSAQPPDPIQGSTSMRPPTPHVSASESLDSASIAVDVDTLTREDFGIDLDRVQFPDHDGPLTDAEMNAAVQSFLDSLRTQ